MLRLVPQLSFQLHSQPLQKTRSTFLLRVGGVFVLRSLREKGGNRQTTGTTILGISGNQAAPFRKKVAGYQFSPQTSKTGITRHELCRVGTLPLTPATIMPVFQPKTVPRY